MQAERTAAAAEDQISQIDLIGWLVTAIAVAIAAISLWYNAKATRKAHEMTSKSLD